jgi:hypothetical protein
MQGPNGSFRSTDIALQSTGRVAREGVSFVKALPRC